METPMSHAERGRLGGSKPKNYSPEERQRRADHARNLAANRTKPVKATNKDVDDAIDALLAEFQDFHVHCRIRRFKARAKCARAVLVHVGPGCEIRDYIDAILQADSKNLYLLALLYHGCPKQELPEACAQVPMYSTIKNSELRRIGDVAELYTALVEFRPDIKLDALTTFMESGQLPMKERVRGSL